MVNNTKASYWRLHWLCAVRGPLITITICLSILHHSVRAGNLSRLAEKPKESPGAIALSPSLSNGTATFEFPFLGVIRARESIESTPFVDSESRKLTLRFRVFKDHDGNFIRAEYVKKGAKNPEWPVVHIQEAMEMREQRVVSLVDAAPPVQWAEVLKAVASEMPLSEAIRINITYVNYKILDQPTCPVFVVNVFGAVYPLLNTYQELPGAEKRRKVRILFDRFGKMLRADNCL